MRRVPLALGLAAGVLSGLIVGRRLATPKVMPHLRVWQRMLAEQRDTKRAATLAHRIQARYETLCARRPRASDRASRVHLEKRILPGLALYQVLREESEDQEAVLAQVETLFRAVFFVQLRKLIPLLRFLPDPFPLVRRALHQMSKGADQTDAQEIVEDSDECFAINAYRCFTLDVLSAYGAPELTILYCATDDWLAEALPGTIAWERTKTLGRGDDCCDFRWRRVA